MAKLTVRVQADPILAKHNEIVTLINEGNYISELTESEALVIINADNTKRLLVHITETMQLEYWFVKDGQLVRRKVA